MSLRGFGRLLGALIVAQDYLDIDTVSQPGRRLKFRPGKNFLFRLVATRFASDRWEITVRSIPKLLKLLMAAALYPSRWSRDRLEWAKWCIPLPLRMAIRVSTSFLPA
jgi:hypothetical protein